MALEALETDQAERLAGGIAGRRRSRRDRGRGAEAGAAPAAGTSAQRGFAASRTVHLSHLRRARPRKIGDAVTETLDYVPGRFKGLPSRSGGSPAHSRETIVPDLPHSNCGTCADHAIARGRAGAGLLAHSVVSKYDDHLPLYRQAEIFARNGVSLETSTLSGWVGATAATLKPLVDALAADVLASDTLHVDDTPVPVLAPGTGKTKTGRLWTPASAGAGLYGAFGVK